MAVYQLKFHGTLNGGAEQFVHSLVIDDVGALLNDEQAAANEGVGALNNTLPGSSMLDLFPTQTVWTHVTAARVLDLATGRLSAAFRQDLPTPIIGTTGFPMPPQCAWVVSLRAGTYANGSPLRGRFYLPAPNTSEIDADGRVTVVNRDIALGWAVAFIQEFNDDLADRAAQVWSRGAVAGSNAKGMATTQTIDEVRVGRVIDTIRSRRGNLIEDYAAANIPA